MTEAIASFFATLLHPFSVFFQAGERIYWGYLLIAFAFAAMVFLNDKSRKTTSLLAYLFPKAIYANPSTLKDVQFFFLSFILLATFFLPLLGSLATACSDFSQDVLGPLGITGTLGQPSIAVSLIATVVIALAMDFALYLQHYAMHRVPWLWEFHKVHHSAEVLNPLTVYRMHPVDTLSAMVLTGIASGLVEGVFQYFFIGQVGLFNVQGTNVLFWLFYMLGYNLRHSHIWLDYGPFWDQFLISPAQHQVHHSAEQRHWDKNMGFIFAFWDRLFGTLYVPKGREQFSLGLSEADENREFDSLYGLFIYPIQRVLHFRPLVPRHHLKLATCSAVIALFLAASFQNYTKIHSKPVVATPIDTVYLEDLTWTEVRDRLKNGYVTVIVPTGGTEQNGPHMILGKHNYVVRHTAGETARKLGHTLVAPVISYVPEGDITPPTGHMQYAGTISIPEETFAQILESTARSLKAHGVRLICFLGDSGGNQAVQQQVAEQLNQEWGKEGVRVLSVDQYYFHNGQQMWLLNQGKTMTAIGSHAGIRDTSELMRVYPQGVRPVLTQGPVDQDGVIGDPSQASVELGERMLRLKTHAAVRQISHAQRALKQQ